MNVFGCEMCKYKCTKKSNLDIHLSTKKHLELAKQQNMPQSSTKKQKGFYCETCAFRCDKQSDYTRHLKTQKHINKTQNNGSASGKNTGRDKTQVPLGETHVPSGAEGVQINSGELCSNEFTQSCSEFTTISTELLIKILQQNKELAKMFSEEKHQRKEMTNMFSEEKQQRKEMENLLLKEQQKTNEQYAELLEYCKEPKHITTNNQNHFNLNFFLNVTCKDALNMSDFIRDLEIQIEDVESVSRLGFVEGITQILVNRLKGLEIHQRPIHCTDVKRDVLYIKDDNRWEKDAENTKIKHVIETVEQRNCRIASCEMKPDFLYSDESRMDKYMSLLREVNGGGSREKNHEKIVKNIAKTFVVERNTIPSASSSSSSSASATI